MTGLDAKLDLAHFDRDGFAAVANVVNDEARSAAEEAFERLETRAGSRRALEDPAIGAIAGSSAVRAIAAATVGPDPRCARAILFNKGQHSNWRVRWHQDTVIQVSARFDEAGWTAWSEKEGQTCVRPPVEVLERRIAIRVDLDGSDETNGGLRVVPGSHRFGVLTPDASRGLRDEVEEVTPRVDPGGALVIRPLLLHASGLSVEGRARRVVHLEFCRAADQR